MLAKINIAMLFFAMTYFRTNNISIPSSDIVNAVDTAYLLNWSDEFNTKGSPDANNWGFENGFVRNLELQWYQQDNAVCRNGVLVIEARHEIKSNPNYVAGSDDWRKNRKDIICASPRMTTQWKKSWRYGRFIMRAKIPIDKGI